MEITGNIVYTVKFAIVLLIYILGGQAITLFLALTFHLLFILISGFLIFLILPLIYPKPFRKLFTRKVKIVFNESSFTVNFEGFEENYSKNQFFYEYKNISSCKLNSQRNGYSTLIILLNNGSSIRYTFYDEGERINSSELVYKQLLVNSNKFTQNNIIELSPSFYSSKLGTFLISLLGLGITCVIIYQLFNSHKYLPVSFIITIGFFVQIFIARKRDDDIRKRFNK